MQPTDFEATYQSDPDPFDVDGSWYERRKESLLLAGLTRERYASAWDCACGTGHLARALAERCDHVLATDASPTAVRLTKERNATAPGVRCAVSKLPDRPAGVGDTDLTVVAEVLYYLPDDDRAEALDLLTGMQGELVAVHWRHHPDDAYLSGAAVTDELGGALTAAGWTLSWRHDDTDFVMAGWLRTP
jgi:SAM-dependent methyltransferase